MNQIAAIKDPEEGSEKKKKSNEAISGEEKKEDPMEQEMESLTPATVFCIRLKQPKSNLLYKMSVPEICRNFRSVDDQLPWMYFIMLWSVDAGLASAPYFDGHTHIISQVTTIPKTMYFDVTASFYNHGCCSFTVLLVLFDLIFHSGRNAKIGLTMILLVILSSSSNGPPPAVLVHYWGKLILHLMLAAGCESMSGGKILQLLRSGYQGSPWWLSSKPSGPANSRSTFEEKFLSQQCQTSGSVQLHWSQWPPQNATPPKWFCTSKGPLGCGPSGIMAGDAIITDSGAMHVAGVPIVNPSTIVVWEVMPGPGNGFQVIPRTSTNNGVPPPLSSPNWTGFAPLAAYLFSWQDHLLSEEKQGKNQTNQNLGDSIPLNCSPVSNFSAYVSPETAAQTAATTTWGSGVTAVAFDPTCGGSVIAVVIAEGQYMSPYDPDEGPSITGWRVQLWESSLQHVVLHPIFGNPTSSMGGQPPMQTVWQTKVDLSIPPTNDFKNHQAPAVGMNTDIQKVSEFGFDKSKRVNFDPFDLPSDVRALARIVYSPHGGEIAIAFLRGGVHIFSGPNFAPVDNYQISVGSAIAAPAFSSTSCCSASVWHDPSKDQTILKIIRVLPPAIPTSQVKTNSSNWERAIAERKSRFWWSLLVGVNWWDAVGCTQSAAEDGIVSLNSVIAVLDADFHSLPSAQHRQQYCPVYFSELSPLAFSLDRIKCRLLEGANAQEVRAMVLDMQARLLLDMLGKGIESALINPSALVPDPWQVSSETLTSIDPEAVAVEPALVPCVQNCFNITQAYVDSVLDLASHFITRLRRYASFCRTLASHAVTAGTGNNRNVVASPAQCSATPATSQGGQNGTTSSSGSTQMQAWVQGAIAKISSTTDGVSNPVPNPPISGPSSFMPISINTGTFPGTPAVRLIGDCHFLHRLCQLLLFCFFFRRAQQPRYAGGVQRTADTNLQKPQPNASVPGKVEEIAKPVSTVVRPDDGQAGRVSQLVPASKGGEEPSPGRSRIGTGNAGLGYTYEEVKVLFLVLMDLCRRTAGLQHPLPVSQVGSNNIQVRLHYIDGNYTVLPEVVEAALGPHMQNMPRPRGADAAGLLLRELELHPPAEEWHRRNMFGGPWSDPDDLDSANDAPKLISLNPLDSSSLENCDVYYGANGLWPRKRRMSERDAAFGLNTSVGLGAYLGIMGSRRDVVTALWKTGLEGIWYKCIRCLRQTCAFASPASTNLPSQNDREIWWISRWAYGCPMCGGTWVRVV
ncbi:hypothetical protein JHK85_037915 [Glycine max]|nr:hypothetical protein JHK85_037915 [Glycine max]